MKQSPKKSGKPNSAKKESDPGVYLGIRVERETKAKLSVIAKKERRSISGQALLFIERGVKHQEDSETYTSGISPSASGVKHPIDTPVSKRKPTRK